MGLWKYVLRNPLALALLIYLIVILLVVLVKPRALWDERRKRYRHFGTAREETIYPLWMIATILGVLCYSISTVVYWVYGRTLVAENVPANVTSAGAVATAAPAPLAPPPAPPPAPLAPPTPVVQTDSFTITPDNPMPQRGGTGFGRPAAASRVRVPHSRIWMDAMS